MAWRKYITGGVLALLICAVLVIGSRHRRGPQGLDARPSIAIQRSEPQPPEAPPASRALDPAATDPSTLIFDAFSGPGGVDLATHRAQVGGSWSALPGTSGVLALRGDGSAGCEQSLAYYVCGAPPDDNYRVAATFSRPPGETRGPVAVLARALDGNNYYAFAHDGNNDRWDLLKVSKGRTEVLAASHFQWRAGSRYTIRLTPIDQTKSTLLRCEWSADDGASWQRALPDYTDTDPLRSPGRPGIHLYYARVDARVRDFRVDLAVGPDTTPPRVDAANIRCAGDGIYLDIPYIEADSPPVRPRGAEPRGFTVLEDGVAKTWSSRALDELTQRLTFSTPVRPGAVLTLSYDAAIGNVTDSAPRRNAVASFERLAVLNPVPYPGAVVTQYGITWRFNAPVRSGRFLTGDWWVCARRDGDPVTCVSVTPAPTGTGALARNGSVRNPTLAHAGSRGYTAAPYDGRMSNYSGAERVSFPAVLRPGDSLVSTESMPDALPAPSSPPQITIEGGGGELQAGTYQAAYSFATAAFGKEGQTPISPPAGVSVLSGQHLRFAPIRLPPGATAVHYFLSIAPDSPSLGLEGSGDGTAHFARSCGSRKLPPPSLNTSAGYSLDEAAQDPEGKPWPASYRTFDTAIPAYTAWLKNAAILTVLASPPPDDSFRPPYAGSDKPLFAAAQLRTDLLPRLAAPPSAASFDALQRCMQRPWTDIAANYFAGEFEAVQNQSCSYGRNFMHVMGDAGLLLCCDYPVERKRPLLFALVQHGIDCYYAARIDPNLWQPNGGFKMGRKFPILLAARLLGTEWDLRGVAFQEDIDFYLGDLQTPRQRLWTGWAESGHPYSANVLRATGGPANAFEQFPPAQWSLARLPWDKDDGYARQNSKAIVGLVTAAELLGLAPAWKNDALFAYTDRWMNEPWAPVLTRMTAAAAANRWNDADRYDGHDWSNPHDSFYADGQGTTLTIAGRSFAADMYRRYRGTVRARYGVADSTGR